MVGQGLKYIAFFLYSTLLLTWIFELTGSSLAVSAVVIATTLPACIVGPIAGVFVDRWKRRTIMVVTIMILIVAVIPPLLVPTTLRLFAIYGSAILASASSCFFMPATSGLLQTLVPEHQQNQAAYLSKALYTGGFVVGPAMAPVLFFAVGAITSSMLVIVLFALAAGCLLILSLPLEEDKPANQPEQSHTPLQSARAIGEELLVGIRFIAHTRVLFILLAASCLEMFGSSVFNALNIIFVTRQLHVDVQFLGPINAAIGIGTLIGVVIMGFLMKWIASRWLFAGGILLLGIGVMFYAWQTAFFPALFIIGLACIPQSGIDVGLGPILIRATPTHIIGRVQSVVETAMLVVTVPSLLLAGYVGQFLSIDMLFLLAGGCIATGGIIAFFGLPKERATKPKK
jgi:MFS family permease